LILFLYSGLSSITILDGGFGYSAEKNIPALVETDVSDTEQIFSIKAKGDFGIIRNVEVSPSGNPPAIEFTLESENYPQIIPNMEYNPLTFGDYFIITDSNVRSGHALTGITTSLGGLSNYPESKVGTSIGFIDGIYSVENITTSLGISTVTCYFLPAVGIVLDSINVTVGINTLGFYGRYSFGVVYDYQNRARENPKSFTINKDNGIIGINSGPIVYRTRSII